MVDPAGNFPQWLEDIWNTLKDFFSPQTGSVSKTYNDGVTSAQASLTAGYSEFTIGGIGQQEAKNRKYNEYQNDGFAGLTGNISVVNFDIGGSSITGDNTTVSGNATADVLALTGYAGYQYKNGFGIGAGAYATALTGTLSVEYDIYGWSIIIGATGDIGAIGIEGRCGFTNGVAELKAKCAAGIGGGFFVQFSIPEYLY